MKFNFNEYIKVKLTDRGKQILRQRHDELSKVIASRSGKGIVYTPPVVDREGYTKFQGWDLMQVFGQFMGLGQELPFDLNAVIEENQ